MASQEDLVWFWFQDYGSGVPDEEEEEYVPSKKKRQKDRGGATPKVCQWGNQVDSVELFMCIFLALK